MKISTSALPPSTSSRSWLIRLCALAVTAASLIATASAPAQTSTNEYPVAEQGEQSDAPGRVGRISMLSGSVSLTHLENDETEAATLNFPITSEWRLTSGNQGRAEVRIGSVALRLDDNTIVDFNRIDDEVIQLYVHQGSVAFRVRSRDVLRELDVITPRERVVFDDVGRYRLDVNRSGEITALTAFAGHARITRGYMSFPVQSGARGELGPSAESSLVVITPVPDSFDDWVAARDQRDETSRSAQYVSRETTGMESLDEHGTWISTPEYGTVWAPTHVVSGWAPYRYGRWVWVSPWGWTWVDDAPWGFAPFHYGRWVTYHGRWCWTPGRWAARPYYAPALVAWVHQPGVSISISSGHPVGWFPLGWNEAYRPGYRYSPRYIRNVNVQNVTNITNVTVVNAPRTYVHQRRPENVSWAPARSLPRRERIQDVMHGRAPDDLVRAAPVMRSPVERPERSDRSDRSDRQDRGSGAHPRAERPPVTGGTAAPLLPDNANRVFKRPPTAAPNAKPDDHERNARDQRGNGNSNNLNNARDTDNAVKIPRQVLPRPQMNPPQRPSVQTPSTQVPELRTPDPRTQPPGGLKAQPAPRERERDREPRQPERIAPVQPQPPRTPQVQPPQPVQAPPQSIGVPSAREPMQPSRPMREERSEPRQFKQSPGDQRGERGERGDRGDRGDRGGPRGGGGERGEGGGQRFGVRP